MRKNLLSFVVLLLFVPCLSGCLVIDVPPKDSADETEIRGRYIEHFLGEILSYEDSNDGFVAIVNDLYSSGENVRILITDQASLCYPEEENIRKMVDTRQTGICVYVLSEFYADTQYDAYPATMIVLTPQTPSQESPSEIGGVGYSGVIQAEIVQNENSPDTPEQLSVVWANKSSDDPIHDCYTRREFQIDYWNGEKWISCTPDEPSYDLTPILLPAFTYPHRATTVSYDITGFDLSRSGTYRMITYYSRSAEFTHPIAMIVEFQHSGSENPSPSTLDELVENRFLIDCTEDAGWRNKLTPTNPEHREIVNVYEGKIHENGKRMIYVKLIVAPDGDVEMLTKLAAQFHIEESHATRTRVRIRCGRALGNHFLAHIKSQSDILLSSPDGIVGGRFVLYATDEEIEQYAKCSCVSQILDGEEMYKSLMTPNKNDG